MKKIRLEDLGRELAGREGWPAERPDPPLDREMADRWLEQHWPKAFGAVHIPIAAETFVTIRNVTIYEDLPQWAQGLISARAVMRNTHFRTLQTMSAAGNFWHDLNGQPERPIAEEERRWAASEVKRLEEERRR